MTTLINAIPANCWLILAVALSGFILMVGLRMLRKGFDIKFGKNREIKCDRQTDVHNKDELA